MSLEIAKCKSKEKFQLELKQKRNIEAECGTGTVDQFVFFPVTNSTALIFALFGERNSLTTAVKMLAPGHGFTKNQFTTW